MKLEKAIETLTLISTNLKGSLGYEGVDATKLGIEALKRIKACREPEGGSPLQPLAGVTEV